MQIETVSSNTAKQNRFAEKFVSTRHAAKRIARDIDNYLCLKEETSPDDDRLFKFGNNLTRYNHVAYQVKEENKPQIIGAWYYRHALNPTWAWRKANLVRSVWHKYLTKSDTLQKYLPYQLVLTLKHNIDTPFYFNEIIERFNILRKHKAFPIHIAGGEYNTEITYNEKTGWHIHLHCLVFCKKGTHDITVRNYLQKIWSRLTGNSFIIYFAKAYNKVYCEKTGKVKTRVQINKQGKITHVPVCKYVSHTSTPDELRSAITELIKYHYKFSAFKNDDGTNNIPLYRTVLRELNKRRLYSRFGIFYNIKELNLSGSKAALVEGGQDDSPTGGNMATIFDSTLPVYFAHFSHYWRMLKGFTRVDTDKGMHFSTVFGLAKAILCTNFAH